MFELHCKNEEDFNLNNVMRYLIMLDMSNIRTKKYLRNAWFIMKDIAKKAFGYSEATIPKVKFESKHKTVKEKEEEFDEHQYIQLKEALIKSKQYREAMLIMLIWKFHIKPSEVRYVRYVDFREATKTFKLCTKHGDIDHKMDEEIISIFNKLEKQAKPFANISITQRKGPRQNHLIEGHFIFPGYINYTNNLFSNTFKKYVSCFNCSALQMADFSKSMAKHR